MDQYSRIKTSKDIRAKDIYTTLYGRNILWQLFILMELEQLSYYCMITQDTESQSRDIIIDVSGPILTHKNIKAYMGQQYTYHTRWEKNVAILHINGARAVFLLFGEHQDSGS